MKILDISWPITADMTAYKDRAVVRIEDTKNFERDRVRESQVTLGAHTGTHIDAPAHFMGDGITINNCSLTATIGPCVVIDMTHCIESISRKDLQENESLFSKQAIVLFKTRNSNRIATDTFDTQFIYLSHDAAAYLVERSVKAVGIDYLGIERNQPAHETHLILMQHGVAIIEGLRLADVAPGNYFLWCLPLAFVGIEAAPARAVLVVD